MHAILQKSQIKICNFFFITCFDHPNSTVSQLVRIIEILLYNIYNTQVSTCLHTIYCRYCPFQCRNSVSIFFFTKKPQTREVLFDAWFCMQALNLTNISTYAMCNAEIRMLEKIDVYFYVYVLGLNEWNCSRASVPCK